MPLGTEVGLGPGDIVADRDPAPLHGKWHSSPPTFRAMSIVANYGWLISVKFNLDRRMTSLLLGHKPRRKCDEFGNI